MPKESEQQTSEQISGSDICIPKSLNDRDVTDPVPLQRSPSVFVLVTNLEGDVLGLAGGENHEAGLVLDILSKHEDSLLDVHHVEPETLLMPLGLDVYNVDKDSFRMLCGVLHHIPSSVLREFLNLPASVRLHILVSR